MRMKRVLAWVLACGMLLGQTVWAQDINVETEEVGQGLENNQRDDENSIISSDGASEEIKEENISEETEAAQRKEASDVAIQKEDIQEEYEETSDVAIQKEDIQEEYKEAATEEYTAEKSVDEQAGEIIKKTICIDYPIIVNTGFGVWYEGEEEQSYTVQSENEEICEATGDILENINGVKRACFTLRGKREGTTMVNVTYPAGTKRYEITVNNLPEDAVMFQDTILRSRLFDSAYNIDVNGDGCINKSELEKTTYMDLSANMYSSVGSVKNLSGLENAVNLGELNLRDNKELQDINVLFGLEKLDYVCLQGTNVSNADRWKLADFKDCTLSKGDQIDLPSLGAIFEEGLSVEAVSNKDCVDIQEDSGKVEIVAKEAGEVKLHISYEELSKDITVIIQGISADQEVGEEYPVEIWPRPSVSANSFYSNEGLILNSNHQLWRLYPEAVKKKDNVKEYVANWVYYGTKNADAEVCTYLLDNDKKLWKDTEKLAENIERFDGRYALDTQGVLHNVYNSGNEQIENVADWVSPSYSDKGIAYILKTDGTLWTRQEKVGSQAPEEWKQMDNNVKQIYDEGYLKIDGTVVSFDGTETTDIKADRMCEDGSFYDRDGNYYFCTTKWNDSTHTREKVYINIGSIDVEQVQTYDNGIYVLNQNKQVYKYDMITNKLELLISDVLRMNLYYFGSWAFQLNNGKYYDLNGNALTEACIGYTRQGSDNDLIWYEDGSQILKRNGISILSNVTLIWSDRIEGKWMAYACRTDGTIWDITEVPRQILDLKLESYIKGDVNEDGDVNIKDLQIVLRGVCEKIELTERQKLIADVVEDGLVDIQDLRKELRYVCGKIESLD